MVLDQLGSFYCIATYVDYVDKALFWALDPTDMDLCRIFHCLYCHPCRMGTATMAFFTPSPPPSPHLDSYHAPHPHRLNNGACDYP